MGTSYEKLTSLYLEELSSLDAFAASREAEGRLLLAREDPDVRRILEAVAFFSARTRAAAAASTTAAIRRIAAGTLDDLFPVAPASLLVAARAGAELPEPVNIAAGTQLRVKAADGRTGIFSTDLPMTVIPARIEGAGLVPHDRRLTVRVRLAALRAFRSPRVIALHIRRLNDYRASLALRDALEKHLVRAFVTVDGKEATLPCEVTFGERAPRIIPEETGDPGPLARARAFFHMPDRDLFAHVEAPVSSWSTLAIHFEVDEGFPTDLTVSDDTFHLSVVPTSNVWSDYAEPIVCDGTKDSYPIRHTSPLLHNVDLFTVRGVYRSTEAGLSPLLPAALSQEGDVFEVLDEGADPSLAVRMAGTFERPVKLMVDARWSQPGLWSGAAGKLAIALQTRHLPGVSWSALGAMRRPEPSVLGARPERALDLLSRRMLPALDRRDLSGVLEILGTTADGPYLGAHVWLDDLSAIEEPDPAQAKGGLRRRYRITLRRRSAEDEPLVRRLLAQIEALLVSWTDQAVIVESSIVTDTRKRGTSS